MSFSYTFELFPQDKIVIQPFKKIEGDNIKTIQDQFKAQGCTAIVLNSELVFLKPDLSFNLARYYPLNIFSLL